jgi:CelD/BcsL family acetyltransferase involved in cellulose biosynthesis
MSPEIATTSRPPVGNSGSTGVVVRVSHDFSALPSLLQEWERLFRSRPNEPSTSFEWTAAMARHHVQPGDRPFLVRLERKGMLAGILPLILRRHKVLGRTVTLLAPLAEDYNTHSDVLLDSTDDEVVRAVVSALFSLHADWDCFRMSRLLESNQLVTAMCRALGAGNHAHALREGLPAYMLDLPNSYDAYLAARTAKFRNHLKRTERKLSQHRIEVKELTRDAGFNDAFAALLQIERASWKEAHGSSITAVTRQSGFYRDFGRAAFGAGRLQLQWLSIDSRPVAYNLGYLTQAGYHYLKTSYDREYRPLSPATVLRARLIESLIARGVTRLDFPGEPYQWETQWTETARRRVVLTVYRATVRGRMLALIDRWRRLGPSARGITHVDPRGGRHSRVGAA